MQALNLAVIRVKRNRLFRCLERGIIAGLPIKKWFPELENASLWCVTETKTKADIDQLAKTLREVL